MDKDIYAAPASDVSDVDDGLEHEFYVVSVKKFILLFMMTFGLYSVYWFYRNWSSYKAKHSAEMWPVARGIFAIFFAHKLFKSIDDALCERSSGYNWSPGLLAGLYVALVVGSRILDRISGSEGFSVLDALSLATTPLLCVVLVRVQVAINTSQNDALGRCNERFTAPNYIWCALGALVWLCVALVILAALGVLDAFI